MFALRKSDVQNDIEIVFVAEETRAFTVCSRNRARTASLRTKRLKTFVFCCQLFPLGCNCAPYSNERCVNKSRKNQLGDLKTTRTEVKPVPLSRQTLRSRIYIREKKSNKETTEKQAAFVLLGSGTRTINRQDVSSLCDRLISPRANALAKEAVKRVAAKKEIQSRLNVPARVSQSQPVTLIPQSRPTRFARQVGAVAAWRWQ